YSVIFHNTILCSYPLATLPTRLTGPGFLGGFCFASFSFARSSFSPRFSMRSLDAAAFSWLLFCRNFDFGTLCPEVPPPLSAPAASLCPGPAPLFGFRFILHILRAGGQQVIDLAFREPIHKGDGHIPIEQQALAG